MGYLAATLTSLFLLAAFVVLTYYEKRHGARYFGVWRGRVDAEAARFGFVLAHVDFAAFMREEAQRLATRLGHDSAHLTLRAVRAVERLLTRMVRHLRARREVTEAPRETNRDFVRTLADFKGQLEATRPEAPELP